MKDLKTYLESGILELYILGDLSMEEMLEVEEMAAQNSEVKAELDAIENALQAYAQANSIQPSTAVRKRILAVLDSNPASEKEIPVRQLNPSGKASDFYKYAFAASVALLLVSVLLLLNLNNQLKESNSQLAVLESANQQFSNRVNYMDKELEDSRKFLEIYQKPSEYIMVDLKGSPKAPQAGLTVAFHPAKEEVMIDLSTLKMPSNDDQHQYQLLSLIHI